MANSASEHGVKINPDLAKERKKCTFNVSELTHLLDGGVEQTRKRRELENFFLNDPEVMDGTPFDYLSYKEKFMEAVRKMYILGKKLTKHGQDGMEIYRKIAGTILENTIFKDGTPMDLHFNMFIPTIVTQGTDEQKEKWLPRALSCNIIGTYAQTEMGHGTFVRGLETTAHYDPKTEKFILNSPTLTSYKWWPSSLANVANYAIVVAQLYSLGQCHGIHLFVVQLRDEETHRALPGIKLGDIGAGFGMSGSNNGYLAFDNFALPRQNMLMKNSKILSDGTYIASINNKLVYRTMVLSRVELVKAAADYIKKSVTVAVRYSAVRRQSQQTPGAPESQIMDYLTQQHKIFPQIAAGLAYSYSSAWLQNMLVQVSVELEDGNLSQLPELHALSSCLKAISTYDASAAIETCRMACGGHGYMMCSGFPISYGLITPMCTYEGENTVLLLQTARSLMKEWSKVLEGKPLGHINEYLNASRNVKKQPFQKSIKWIVWALEKISSSKIELAWTRMNSKIKGGSTPEDAWNLTSIELLAAAEAYARTFVVKMFNDSITTATKTCSEPLKIVLLQLLDLYGVYILQKLGGDLLRFTVIDRSSIDDIQSWLIELLVLIRPNAVGLVDGFDIHDEVLASVLGAYDGNVYERLFAESAKSPLNSEPVNKSFDLYLKPFMRSKY